MNVLIVGGSTSGKSTLAGLLMEQLVAKGYSICVLDPEGDHFTLGELRGMLVVGGADPLPRPERIATLLSHRFGSVVVNMSRLYGTEKRRYTQALLAELRRLRLRTGLPHWIVVDEAPQLLGAGRLPDDEPGVPSQRFCLVTHRPEDLDPAVREQIDVLLVLPGGEPFAAGAGHLSGTAIEPLAIGEALYLEPGARKRFRIGARRCPHVRHWQKYLSNELPPHHRFYFRTREGPTGISAANVERFHCEIAHAAPAVLVHHLAEGDFSRWISGVLSDGTLAGAVHGIERAWREGDRSSVEPFRGQLLTAIEERYRGRAPAFGAAGRAAAPPA